MGEWPTWKLNGETGWGPCNGSKGAKVYREAVARLLQGHQHMYQSPFLSPSKFQQLYYNTCLVGITLP